MEKFSQPYRFVDSDADDHAALGGFEERAVSVVLSVCGALGLFVGISAPRENATELVIGVLFSVLGALTLIERSRRRSTRTTA